MTKIGVDADVLAAAVKEAEDIFAEAIKQVFATTLAHVYTQFHAITGSDGDFLSQDDVMMSRAVWTDALPKVEATIRAAFGASAHGVGVTITGNSVPLPFAVSRPLYDQAAEQYLSTVHNRLAGIGDTMWGSMRDDLTEGFRAGESIDNISARLQDTAALAESRARTIARTEIIGASNAGALAGATALPEEIRPKTKTWLATGDARTRPSHAEADGQVVDLNDNFIVGGAYLQFPGDDGPPEEVINCRCTVLFDDGTEAGADDIDTAEEEVATESEADIAAPGALGRREAAAAAYGVTPTQVQQSIPDVHALRASVRAEAAAVQRDALGWLDQADAFRIRSRPAGYRGGEYDWLERLDPRERSRLQARWFSTNDVDLPDVVMAHARESGVFTGDTVDQFMEQWLHQTRRADAAGALRLGRLPATRRMGGMSWSDITTVLEQQGYDLPRILDATVEDAAGYLASFQQDQYADRAFSLLQGAATSPDPPWAMSYQAWERELRETEEGLADARAAGTSRVDLAARHAELVPSKLDRGQDYEALYAEIIETARVAGMNVADHAVIPWAT